MKETNGTEPHGPWAKSSTTPEPAPAGPHELFEMTYNELRSLARAYVRGEKHKLTLQPTALVHEAYLRLSQASPARFASRRQFLAVAARAMRQVLVEEARRRQRQKRGGGRERVTLVEGIALELPRDPGVLDLDAKLKELQAVDARKAAIVELRFFAGLSGTEVAAELGLSTATVTRDWRLARAWLYKELAHLG